MPAICTLLLLGNVVCDLVEKQALPGDGAEIGGSWEIPRFCWRTSRGELEARRICSIRSKKLPERDFIGVDLSYQDRKSDFIDTSIEAVRGLVGSPNVELIAGYFPDSITDASAKTQYALVHLDCDLYAPTYAGLGFFYPQTGARWISHNPRLHEPLLGWRREGN